MTHEEFMKLKLENIDEEELNPGFVHMWVNIQGCRYGLEVRIGNRNPKVASLSHSDWQKTCQLCGNKFGSCEILEPYKDDLFRRLVHSKELRLEWVTKRQFDWD